MIRRLARWIIRDEIAKLHAEASKWSGMWSKARALYRDELELSQQRAAQLEARKTHVVHHVLPTITRAEALAQFGRDE